ncbi:MAG: hypothetical protein IKD35_01745, partial [Clostridia bacterium]|nr:hypothetical protein [Clostridia bacterium]
IAGREGNSELGAYLKSNAGYNFCFNLRTQPTLIIGYFVKQQDGYGIGTMAGLLIATEYFKGNFTNEDTMSYDFVQTPIDINDSNLIDNLPPGTWNSWEELLSEVDYHPAGYVHNGTTYGPSKLYKDIQSRMNSAPSGSALREALVAELKSFEVVFEQLEGQGSAELQFVYWKAEEIVDGAQYKKFYLINNIDGILTDSDMEMLRGAFGTEFGVNWGAGTSFLGNVLFAEEGSAVILNSSVFDKFKDEEGVEHSFDGTFNGMGYIIDHLNITKIITSAKDGDVINVGMFESVKAPANPADGGGYVTGLNFRNLSIYVVDNSNKNITINVGAVVGYNMSTALMQDITVHGTISVRSAQGTVNVGGVIGYDETGYVDGGGSAVLEGAIVVATIRAEGATVVAGGIVGVMSVYQNTIKDVVSLSEIYVKSENASANGFVGTYKGVVDGFVQTKDGKDYEPLSTVSDEENYVTSSAFMNAVFTINANNEYTRVAGYQTAYRYKYVKTYTDLYNGSMTAFKNQIYSDAVGQPYGLYDVVSEYNIAITAESKINTRGSMRLKDIVDIYVLGYGLTRTDVSVSDGKISSFKKETTSKYFHAIADEANNDGYKPDGTDGNPIKIAYQQHLSLLRMFNYMSFEIVGDIKMYTGYNLAVVDEAFTGKIDAKGHEVNFRNGTAGQMFVYQSNNGADTGAEERTITYDWVVVDPQDEE